MAEQATLDGFPVFEDLEPEQRRQIEKLCRWKRYAAGEQIIDRQSESRDVFFVVQGLVRVVIYSVSGREITLDDLGAGKYFGELSAIDGQPRSASVMALKDTLLAILSPDHFVKLVGERPQLAMQVIQRLAGVVRMSTERIFDLSALGANNRVHAEILRLARRAVEETGEAVIRPAPVHADIASRVSSTRETVARVMSDLTRADIVKREKGALVICDLESLEALVEEVRGE